MHVDAPGTLHYRRTTREVVMRDADPIARQVLQVRRRRNFRELQRALFALVALGAGSAAALVLLALLARPRLFAVATWSAAGAVIVTAGLLLRALRRRWLGADAAADWIDTRAALGGRLSTLLAVRDRAGEAPFFLPLLAEENRRLLERWRPDRMIRRRVPLAALVSALLATTALLVALILAPRLRPPFPEIVYSNQPIEGGEGQPPDGVPERIVVAPSSEGARPSGERDRKPGATADDDDTANDGDDSALARLSDALQDRIRRDLWGREWQVARDAMERAARAEERRARRAARDGASDDGSDLDAQGSEQPWETAGLPATRRAPRPGAGGGEARQGQANETSDADAQARGLGDDDQDRRVGSGAGEPVPGAGNETDPHLFGAPTAVDGTREASSFELAINAPVRAQRNAPKHGGGEPPPASDDAHPALTRAARQEHAVRRMPVPSGYETIVREMFAHRDTTREAP